MELPQKLKAVYDEPNAALAVSVIGTSSAHARSTLDAFRILTAAINEDTGVLRVVNA